MLQIEEPTCIIPPIPQKFMGSTHYSDDSKKIKERMDGFTDFIEFIVSHNLLCANQNLEIFLTGQDSQFE